MSVEIWKDIPGYENIYQASNTGKIRTHENKTTFTQRHGIRKWKQRELKQKGKHSGGGKRVSLWKNGEEKTLLVHRLVACTFLNLELHGKMTVDHIDGNRENNNLENLRIVTLGENIRLAFYEQGLYDGCKKKVKIKQNGIEFNFDSLAESERYLGLYKGVVSKNVGKVFKYKDNEYEVISIN